MHPGNSLSRPEIERLFARLSIRYGALWIRHWEGVDLELVMADWAIQLGGLSGAAIAHALVNLPVNRIPLVGEFRALAIGAPDIFAPQLGYTPTAQERAAQSRIARELRDVLAARCAAKDPKVWAYRLQLREERGEQLGPHQKTAWRAALANTSTTGDAE